MGNLYVYSKRVKKIAEPKLDGGEKITLKHVSFDEFIDIGTDTSVRFIETEVTPKLLEAKAYPDKKKNYVNYLVQNINMIKIIIFDGVNLITHQEPLSIGLVRDYGFSMDKMLPFFTGPLQECVAGKADLKEIFPPYLNDWGWNKGLDAMLDYWFTRDHKIDTEMVSYINDLKNKRGIMFISNQQRKNIALLIC